MKKNYGALGICSTQGKRIWDRANARCAKLHALLAKASGPDFHRIDQEINRLTIEALLRARALNKSTKKKKRSVQRQRLQGSP